MAKRSDIARYHIRSKYDISESPYCFGCPGTVLSDKVKLFYGAGSICSDIVVVLPSYMFVRPVGALSVYDEFIKLYKKISGDINLSNIYITRDVKCRLPNQELIRECRKFCIKHLIVEINRINPSKVLFLLGREYEGFLDSMIGTEYKRNIECQFGINMNIIYTDNSDKIDELSSIIYKFLYDN